jgi:glycosyltransferase involved in cell wall biosynthesis
MLMCQQGSELESRARQAGLNVRAHRYRGEMNPVSLWGLIQAYREFRPHVVNVHRAWAHTQWLVASLITGFRGLVVTRRVLFRPDFNPLSLAKYRSAGVRGFIAVSQAVSARLQELGIPERKIRVVHPATDMQFFSPESAQSLPLPENGAAISASEPTILMVANYHRNKGHHVLLEAFARIAETFPQVRLLLVGHGTDTGELPQKVAEFTHRERISLLGFRADVPRLLLNTRVAVNASFEEGFSGFVREALAMGVPVVASAIPANREMSGCVPMTLFRSGSADELARALAQHLQISPDPATAASLRKQALAQFSVPAMVQKTLAAYEAAVRGCA